MEYKTLGKSQLRVSRIGFGCMSLRPEQNNIQQLIDEAIASGINFFDTADLYDKGVNEENIGRALRAKRSKVVLATKVGNQWKADGSGWDWNPRKKYILKSIEHSLRRLQTDHIDLYQLHGGTINDLIDETIDAFELLQQQGKIRYYGISSIRPNVIKEYIKRSHIVSVMMQYSHLDRRPEENCLQLLHENDIGVLARGTVASGLLAGKPAKPYLNYSAEEVSKAIDAIKQVSGDLNSGATALKFVLHHPAVSTAVVGIRTMEQLREAVDAEGSLPLDETALHLLQNANLMNTYTEHR